MTLRAIIMVSRQSVPGAGRLLRSVEVINGALLAAGRLVFAQHAISWFFQQAGRRQRLLAIYRPEWFSRSGCVTCGGSARQTASSYCSVALPELFRNKRFNSRSRSTTRRTGDRPERDPPTKPRAIFFPQQRRDHIAYHAVHKAALAGR